MISLTSILVVALLMLSLSVSDVTGNIILKKFSSAPSKRVPSPQAQVQVPRGWKVISGGASVKFFGYGQMLTKSIPIVEKGIVTGWQVQSKDHRVGDPGIIQAYAIAMYDPNNNWMVRVVKETSRIDAHPNAGAFLPSTYTLVGGGADASSTGAKSFLVDNYPLKNGWLGSSKDHLISDKTAIVTYAIGIKSKTGKRINTRQIHSTFGPKSHPSGTINPAVGWKLVSGGASVGRGGVGNMLVNLVPSNNGEGFFASAKDHVHFDKQSITVYGVEVQGAVYQ
eukprot:IDg2688t1